MSAGTGSHVELVDEQESLTLDLDLLHAQIVQAADLAGWRGRLSIALVDDERMRELHREFMQIDEPTDVLSFPLEDDCGEVVISTDTAIHNAAERSASPEVEVLLYAIHGTLHLLGFDDHAPDERERMQAEERRLLAALGFTRPD